jgi:hypothetical protein
MFSLVCGHGQNLVNGRGWLAGWLTRSHSGRRSTKPRQWMRSLLQVLQVPSSLRTSSHFWERSSGQRWLLAGRWGHEGMGLRAKRARGIEDRGQRRVVRTLPRTRHVMQPCLVRLRFCLISVADMWAAASALAVLVALLGGAIAVCDLRCVWMTMVVGCSGCGENGGVCGQGVVGGGGGWGAVR